MKTRPLFLAFFVLLFATSCAAPEEEQPLTEAEREAIADTIRQLNEEQWANTNPLTPESFERNMSMWIENPEDYYVGEPGVWVSMIGISSTPEEVRAIFEPSVGTRSPMVSTMIQDHVAVLTRDAALHVAKATFASKNDDGETGMPTPWTFSQLWVRTPDGWKTLHYHQSLKCPNCEE